MDGERACKLRGEGYNYKQIGRLMALEDGRKKDYTRVTIWRAMKQHRERVTHTWKEHERRMAESINKVPDFRRPRG